MKDCDCCRQLELGINGWIFLLYFYFKNLCIWLLEWNMCFKKKLAKNKTQQQKDRQIKEAKPDMKGISSWWWGGLLEPLNLSLSVFRSAHT